MVGASLVALLGCNSEGDTESCSISDRSKDSCYKQEGFSRDGTPYFFDACSSSDKCKYTKPTGSSDDYCVSECYTPTCCQKLGCNSDQYCDTNKYNSSQCVCEEKSYPD
ncbi:hypothetical protein COV12_01510 [Candidatus Woesearchaeota archaeon CG10_big_fil_rev_8_21_14_0_10_32_24]|nr:MAG: hypothetical protein COV12_01510 [Candidatus Woesearchaeota archaeon CG10_big_fil_rev_8_21_14_0_10_32_24]